MKFKKFRAVIRENITEKESGIPQSILDLVKGKEFIFIQYDVNEYKMISSVIDQVPSPTNRGYRFPRRDWYLGNKDFSKIEES